MAQASSAESCFRFGMVQWMRSDLRFRPLKHCRIFLQNNFSTYLLILAEAGRFVQKQMKQLSHLALGPACFNINEPIIFGLPIVRNPMLLIPFIITPLLTVTVIYIGMSTGLVAKPTGIFVPWTMPPIFSGYLATGGNIRSCHANHQYRHLIHRILSIL